MSVVREARTAAGLSQAALARLLGTTQPAIARLEADSANPRVRTLEQALRACGRELAIEAKPRNSSIDETLVAQMLRLSPGARLQLFERNYANVRQFALAGARSRGELA
jgi:transcriptional regulator with XRE-family HTH domain